MNPEITTTQAQFVALFEQRQRELALLPKATLEDLLHESEELCRQMTTPFSLRAAAQIVHAACHNLTS